MVSKQVLKRLSLAALQDLRRNVWLNMATVLIIVISLFTVAVSLAIDAAGKYAIKSFQDKIDISIQLKGDASEDKILKLKSDLESLAEVKNVTYISKDEALQNFKETHKDEKYIESIEELGENPLLAVLNVKTQNLDQYESVDKYITDNGNYAAIINKIDYKENKGVISSFSKTLANIQFGINVLILIFVVISVMIAFNTIRLAMYSHRTEIEIMRLVGASNWYIKMPFVIQGAILGAGGAIFTVIIAQILSAALSARLAGVMPGFDLHAYLLQNWFTVFITLLFIGMGMGVISSFIAIRRYLKN